MNAHNCTIQAIDLHLAEDFFKQCGGQPLTKCDIYLGLENGGKLVAAMGFYFYRHIYEIKLFRYAESENIKGGSSMLFSAGTNLGAKMRVINNLTELFSLSQR